MYDDSFSALGWDVDHAAKMAAVFWIPTDECPMKVPRCWCDYENTGEWGRCMETTEGSDCPVRAKYRDDLHWKRFIADETAKRGRLECIEECEIPHPDRVVSDRVVSDLQASIREHVTLSNAEIACEFYNKHTRWAVVRASAWLEEQVGIPSHERLSALRKQSIKRNRLLPKGIQKTVRQAAADDPDLFGAIKRKTYELQSAYPVLGLGEANAVRSLILKGAEAERLRKPRTIATNKRTQK